MTTDRLGAHVPWNKIDEFLDLILELELKPEIAFKGPDFDTLSADRLARVAARLAKHNLRPTIHAPFFDLNPGALDPLIQQATYQRLSQTLETAARLNAHLMVVHPGYDRWRYPGLEAAWVAQAQAFFPPLLRQARDVNCRLALENIYEETPETLVELVEGLDSEWFGHCFDAGHWQLFGTTPMAEWLNALGDRLFHLHLHDNHGNADDHLPVGDGTIDFNLLFAAIRQFERHPSMTLEAHSAENLKRSLLNGRKFLLAT